MKPQPLIVLSDVAGGSRWFQEVLGLRSGHGGDEYEMLMDGVHLTSAQDWDTMQAVTATARGQACPAPTTSG